MMYTSKEKTLLYKNLRYRLEIIKWLCSKSEPFLIPELLLKTISNIYEYFLDKSIRSNILSILNSIGIELSENEHITLKKMENSLRHCTVYKEISSKLDIPLILSLVRKIESSLKSMESQ